VKRRPIRNRVVRNRALDALIQEIANMGFCGSVMGDGSPSHVSDFIPQTGTVTADQFAEWVMLAEGLEPFAGSEYQASFKKLFIQHMGSEAVDASDLVWFSESANPQ
jgi:hypothetical protein